MKKWLLAISIGFSLLFVVACDASIVPVNSTSTVTTTALPSYTLSELAQYDGLSGHKGYIAVDGLIYDVTSAFPDGKHQGMQLAGTDATSVFASSPHSQELLDSLPLVGRLTSGSATTTTITTTTTSTTTTQTQTELPVFNADTLAAYDGKNGSPAYVAINGIVYDLTSVFVNGMHQGIQMGGTDATVHFESSPHSLAILEGMPVVGTFSSTTNETNPTLPVFTPTTLAAYDGKNGSPAYVAVQGIVYDLTSVFVNGMHQGIQMGGTDATVHFESSPHSLSILEGMPVVGTFSSTTTNETNPTLPVFTLAQLSQYTGAGGTTAYVAVNGVVYDVTNAFTNGTHRGMQLGGTDATTIFASSPHSQSLLDSLPIVGSLEGAPTIPSGQGNTQTGGGTEEEDEDEWEDEDHVNLPQAILDYVAAQYPTATIREAEWEDGHYEVELNNGLELKFDQNGQFLSAEWDD